MKLKVIIGNPPYQDSANRQIYPYFMTNAFELSSRYVCMIVKNDWLAAQDNNKDLVYGTIRDKFFKEQKGKLVYDYSTPGEVFKNVGVAACYFLFDHEAGSDCHYIQQINGNIESDFVADFSGTGQVIKNEVLAKIIKKISLRTTKWCDELNIMNTPFGIDTNGIMNKQAIIDNLETTEKTKSNTILLKSSWGDTYIHPSLVAYDSLRILPYYKVACGEKVNAWARKCENVVTNIIILGPNEACTGSWSLLHYFETLEEANNFTKYMKTQLARATIKAGYPSPKRPGKFYFRFCPMQDFTSNSDIDWNKSVAEINVQLCNKYKLSKSEIEYLNETIKPMD